MIHHLPPPFFPSPSHPAHAQIDLSGNAIATVDNIGALSRATYLSLTGNALEELSAAGIDTLTSLVEIDLSHNLLRTGPCLAARRVVWCVPNAV